MVAFSMGALIIGLLLMAAILAAVGIVIVLIVRGVLKRSKTGMSSRDASYVSVVSKRVDESGSGTAKYFSVFEMESGQRMELELKRKDYNALVENQKGKLKYNGTSFISFEKAES